MSEIDVIKSNDADTETQSSEAAKTCNCPSHGNKIKSVSATSNKLNLEDAFSLML